MLHLLGLMAIAFSAVTGALAAQGRRMDLFGVLVLAGLKWKLSLPVFQTRE